MSELDQSFIQHKLALIERYLKKLEQIEANGKRAFLESDTHYTAERYTELVVGYAIDINFHLLKILDHPAPIKYRDSFIELGRTAILNYELATRLADSAGLRNLLVHQYDDIDLDRLYNGLAGGIADYQAYVKAIVVYAKLSELS